MLKKNTEIRLLCPLGAKLASFAGVARYIHTYTDAVGVGERRG